MLAMGERYDSPNLRLAGLSVWPIEGLRNHFVFYRPIEGGRILHGAREIGCVLESEIVD
jgi:hypothetical protein